MASSGAFFLLCEYAGMNRDDAPVVLGRYSDLALADINALCDELRAEYWGEHHVYMIFEDELESQRDIRRMRAEADIIQSRLAAQERCRSQAPPDLEIPLLAYHLFRQHAARGPCGDGQWMYQGRVSTRKLGPKPFALARLLYERIDQQVRMDTVIGEGGLFDDGTDFGTIGRQCSNITTFFRAEKMPWRVNSSPKKRTMIMKCVEDSAATPTSKSP